MKFSTISRFVAVVMSFQSGLCRDEDKIMKACFWPNEVFEPCFGGCAEVSCDNPRNHLRPCYPYCEPGCVCEEPYVRDDRTHQCVLPQDCSPTQMGIPVLRKKSSSKAVPLSAQRYNRLSRSHIKPDTSAPATAYLDNEPVGITGEEYKRPSEGSRMGNYFNIVIAPPPIKALQPRKVLHGGDAYRSPVKTSQLLT